MTASKCELAFSGLRVLEIGSGAAVAYAGKLFADFGAEVIKLEQTGGDAMRRFPPLLDGHDPASESALNAWLNTNKRSVARRADDQAERAWLARLARSCDVVLDARALDEGLDILAHPVHQGDADALAQAHADAPVKHDTAPKHADTAPTNADTTPIEVYITWFGDSGPYSGFAGSEAVCRALAGSIYCGGVEGEPPHLPHDVQTAVATGLAAFSSATAALMARSDGSRRYVLSVHEIAFSLVEMEAGMAQDGRHLKKRLGVNRFCTTHPGGIYETKEGWIGLFAHTGPQWAALCSAIGCPEHASDPRFANGATRMMHADEIDAFLLPRLRTRSAREWFEALGKAKFPIVIVPTMKELLEQRVHRERGAFVPVTSGGTTFEAPIVPLPMGQAGPLAGGVAPAFDAHGDFYRSQEGLDARAITASSTGSTPSSVVASTAAATPAAATPTAATPAAATPAAAAPKAATPKVATPTAATPKVATPTAATPTAATCAAKASAACAPPSASAQASPDDLPLRHIRVIDLTMGWAGPLAARTLGDFGAEVIKVEGTRYPDWWRGTHYTDEFYQERLYEKNANFALMNRNKLGITLDLTRAEGRQVLFDLVKTADIVIENYSTEVLPKLGLDYPVLSRINPRLVMVSMPAFGAGNDWSNIRAYGGTLEQASGMPHHTGFAKNPPSLTSYAFGDPVGGFNAGAAALLALFVQQRTGLGRHVNLSQVECMLSMTAPFIIEQSVLGQTSPRSGNTHPMYAPQGVYQCAGEDWVAVSVTDDAAWKALVATMQAHDLARDAALDGVAGRRAGQQMIDDRIHAWTRGQSAEAVMQALQDAGVSAGVVKPVWTVMDDPHNRSRQFFIDMSRAYMGKFLATTPWFRHPHSQTEVPRAAPTLGEHNVDVLSRVLGMSASEQQALERAGIIGTAATKKAA